MKTYTVKISEEGTFWYNEAGKRHRENDLPAIEWGDGSKSYWINDVRLTEKEFNNRNRPLLGTKTTINGVEYTLS